MVRQIKDIVESGATATAAREAPWAGLGEAVNAKHSPEQMLTAAKLDWTVSKRPMAYQNAAGVWIPSKVDFALVRDTDERHISTVGSVYKLVQNSDALAFFKKYTEAGHMEMEHAGSLANGQYIWALAHIKADFTLGKNDTVKSYLLLCSPHIHGKAMVFQYMSVRSWCWNTLGRILRAGTKNSTRHAFRMPHSVAFNDDVKENAATALGLGVEQAQEFKAQATLLSKKKAKLADVETFFCEVLRYDPKTASKEKDAKKEREPNKLPKFRAALEHSPGQQLATAAGTWWGALNAVTYVIDHETGRERSTSLRNAWLGHTAQMKRHALDLALQKAK